VLLELLARGYAAIAKRNHRESEAADAGGTTNDPSPSKTLSLVPVHFSETVSLRYQRSRFVVDLETSYHYRVAGTAHDWRQPEGPFIGASIGGSLEWISSKR
jgi:hypothetical protein